MTPVIPSLSRGEPAVPWGGPDRTAANGRSLCYDNQRTFHAALRSRPEGVDVMDVTSEGSLGLMDELIGEGSLRDRVYCEDNGRYVIDAAGRMSCSVHGEIEDQEFVDDHGRVIEVLRQPAL